MAWRIDEQVIRGEIDNRVRGRVTGRIWFVGRDEPVELELAGNAWRDLAGRRLEFTNPEPVAGEIERLAARQEGVIGDCTASRKVKVPDIPMSQIGEYYAAKKKWTWHWGNSLYLEWFSTRNGRVVIESATFQLVVSPEIAWDMTAEEEEAQRQANGAVLEEFMERLSAAAEAAGGGVVKEDTEWENEEPFSEAEAEKMQEESDRLVDRIQARMEREGPDADYEKILEEELERARQERGEEPLTPEQEAERAKWVEEMNRAAEEALANPDPELKEQLERKHPLAEQAFELAVRLSQEIEARGWLPADAGEEHPLADLDAAAMKAGAKLAGALNGEDWPPELEFCAGALVSLKRARVYLDDALRAAESCAEQKIADEAWLADARRGLKEIAEACDGLIAELRGRLERGFD